MVGYFLFYRSIFLLETEWNGTIFIRAFVFSVMNIFGRFRSLVSWKKDGGILIYLFRFTVIFISKFFFLRFFNLILIWKFLWFWMIFIICLKFFFRDGNTYFGELYVLFRYNVFVWRMFFIKGLFFIFELKRKLSVYKILLK